MKTKIEALKQEIEKLQNELKELENEIKYPIYCKSKHTNCIVKFTGFKTAEIIKSKIYNFGKEYNDFITHTNTDTWEDLLVCEETGFYDKQPVWAWDNNHTHIRDLCFYDTKNKGVYSVNGARIGAFYDNYEPYEGKWFDWMHDAFDTLED